MMTKTKKIMGILSIIIVAVVMLTINTDAAYAKRQLKFYAPYPEDSYTTEALVELTAMIKDKTKGEIDFKVFPSGQLGTYEDSIEEVRAGTIDASFTWLTKRYHPMLDIGNLPGLCTSGFPEYELMFLDQKSPFVKLIEKYSAEAGFVSLGGWVDPRIGFILKKVPSNIKDNEKKNISLRTPAMPSVRDMAAAMGYNTVTMDYAEVYSAIQTGQIDGASNIPAEDAYLQARDMIKCFDANNMGSTPGWLIINKKLWESFGEKNRKIVQECITVQLKKWVPIARTIEAKYEKKLEEHGIKVIKYTKEEAIKRSAEVRAQVWPKYADVYGKDTLKMLEDAVIANQKKLAGK